MKTCTNCKRDSNSVKFKKNRRLCLDCFNQYMRSWRAGLTETQKSIQTDAHNRYVKSSVDRFLSYLYIMLRKNVNSQSAKKRISLGKLNSAAIEVTITRDFLFDLWRKQNGFCAITGLELLCRTGNLCSVSIDRIDSNFGYIPDNVQLVCQWVNHAKRHHSNEDIKSVLMRFLTTNTVQITEQI